MNFQSFSNVPHVLPIQDAHVRFKEANSFFLDVRQSDEFQGGHIPGATLIPLGDLPYRLNELPKDREIICVCRSGSRSSVAVGILIHAGYQAVNMSGGMMNWEIAGYPVKKGR